MGAAELELTRYGGTAQDSDQDVRNGAFRREALISGHSGRRPVDTSWKFSRASTAALVAAVHVLLIYLLISLGSTRDKTEAPSVEPMVVRIIDRPPRPPSSILGGGLRHRAESRIVCMACCGNYQRFDWAHRSRGPISFCDRARSDSVVIAGPTLSRQ
jgi:hypothetical protein